MPSDRISLTRTLLRMIAWMGEQAERCGIEWSFGWPGWEIEPDFVNDPEWVPDMLSRYEGLLEAKTWAESSIPGGCPYHPERLSINALRALECRGGCAEGMDDARAFFGPYLGGIPEGLTLGHAANVGRWAAQQIEARRDEAIRRARHRTYTYRNGYGITREIVAGVMEECGMAMTIAEIRDAVNQGRQEGETSRESIHQMLHYHDDLFVKVGEKLWGLVGQKRETSTESPTTEAAPTLKVHCEDVA